MNPKMKTKAVAKLRNGEIFVNQGNESLKSHCKKITL